MPIQQRLQGRKRKKNSPYFWINSRKLLKDSMANFKVRGQRGRSPSLLILAEFNYIVKLIISFVVFALPK